MNLRDVELIFGIFILILIGFLVLFLATLLFSLNLLIILIFFNISTISNIHVFAPPTISHYREIVRMLYNFVFNLFCPAIRCLVVLSSHTVFVLLFHRNWFWCLFFFAISFGVSLSSPSVFVFILPHIPLSSYACIKSIIFQSQI